MTAAIKSFLDSDLAKIESIIQNHPKQIPCDVVAEYCGCAPENIRAAITDGNLGIHWRKPGKLTSGNCIPTAKFTRWILNMNTGFEN